MREDNAKEARRNRYVDTADQTAEVGRPPRNQIEQLQDENAKLRAEVRELELEVLNLYRRLNN